MEAGYRSHKTWDEKVSNPKIAILWLIPTLTTLEAQQYAVSGVCKIGGTRLSRVSRPLLSSQRQSLPNISLNKREDALLSDTSPIESS